MLLFRTLSRHKESALYWRGARGRDRSRVSTVGRLESVLQREFGSFRSTVPSEMAESHSTTTHPAIEKSKATASGSGLRARAVLVERSRWPWMRRYEAEALTPAALSSSLHSDWSDGLMVPALRTEGTRGQDDATATTTTTLWLYRSCCCVKPGMLSIWSGRCCRIRCSNSTEEEEFGMAAPGSQLARSMLERCAAQSRTEPRRTRGSD